MSETKVTEITVQGLTFNAPQPYAAGHVLTEGEASALNQTLAENLRNNFAPKVKSAIAEFRKANEIAEDVEVGVDRLDKEELDRAFLEYAQAYEFGVRRASSPRVPKDPVEAEARKIALEKVKTALKAKGFALQSIDRERLDKLTDDVLAKYPDIREMAKRRVEELSSIADAILEI